MYLFAFMLGGGIAFGLTGGIAQGIISGGFTMYLVWLLWGGK